MTTDYQRVLLAVDLTDASDLVAKRALDVVRRHGAKLTVVHIVEYMPVEPMGEALMPTVTVEADVLTSAEKRLNDFVIRHGVADAERQVVIGHIKSEVVHIAREKNADLIVIGSHERHGLGVLINFTEDAVMHASPCDVLTVRLPD